MKTAIAAVLALASLGLLGVAVAETSALRAPVIDLRVATIELKGFPTGGNFAAAPTPSDAKPAEVKPPDTKPADAKPAEPTPAEVKPAEPKPLDPKPSGAKPVAAKPGEPKPAEPVGATNKPPPPGAPEKKPGAKPGDVAEAPAGPTGPGSTDATLNLRASDTADIYIDGRKAGPSPVNGMKVKAGKHKVRFDCYEASGATSRGPEKVVDVRALEEKDVDFECTAEAATPKPKEDNLP